MTGRILVANVVLNRVQSDEFPDNVTDVVYQKSQFSPVHDGNIDRCTVTDKTVEAVDRALAGEDYSQGALYFMNRSASYSRNVRWFDGKLTYLFQHGGHEFFR
jgi:N-acetylmuramoyl-L-alanine amidase